MLRVRTTFTGIPGAPYLNIMNFNTTTENAASATAATTAVRDFWQMFTAIWPAVFSYQVDPLVDQVTEADGKIVAQFSGTSSTGAGTVGATDLLPPANQALIRWTTGVFLNGRALRGRTFIPCQTESTSVNGVPGGQLVSTTGPNAITALLGNTTVDLVVWSRPRKATATKPFRAGITFPVTTGQIQGKFAVLRSRRD